MQHCEKCTDVKRRYGAIYLLLQLVPVFSMLFLLTAAVSSALWAADMEAERRQQEAARYAPEYTDEPGGRV